MTLGEELELGKMEVTIAQAEGAVAQCHEQLDKAEVQSDAERLAQCCLALEGAQRKVDGLYRRWEELIAKRDSL